MSKHTPEMIKFAEAWESGEIWSGSDLVKRAIKCVNACAGMDDPAAEIAKLRANQQTLMGALENYADCPDRCCCDPSHTTAREHWGGREDADAKLAMEKIKEWEAK